MSAIDTIIDGVIEREGPYVNNPDDPGGETKFGITEKVARDNGWRGRMQDLTREFARDVYYHRYVVAPGFDRLVAMAPRVAAELVDTGVNAGQDRAGKMLQRALNLFNRGGRDFADLVVDGEVGPKTRAALQAFLNKRGEITEELIVRVLDGFQIEHYAAIAEANPAFETFFTGWISHRIENA